MEENQIKRHPGRLENVDLKVGKVVQLERVGFAIVTEIQEDGTPVFTYLHD